MANSLFAVTLLDGKNLAAQTYYSHDVHSYINVIKHRMVVALGRQLVLWSTIA